MSRSFTVKPAASKTQGRGRGTTPTHPQPLLGPGRGRGTQTEVGRGTQFGTRDTSPQRQPPNAGLQQRMSHQGAYTMITPNEERRRQINQQAQQEAERYQRHKEQRKLGHVNYKGTVGGGEISQAEARRNAATQLRNTKMDSLQKRQQYRSDLRQKEEDDALKKKAEQRRKSEANLSLEKNRQEKLESDHRKKNEAFLKRIEAENRAKRVEKLTKSPSGSGTEASGGNDRLNQISGAVSLNYLFMQGSFEIYTSLSVLV
ncbi:hypothetical protein FSP39_025169 [Pinctada imbricata]|uniref:Uncharacterized protein n=1 Tax=Pinctada imbricata TaxID=66713 RepID=A0AA89C4I8_PINIB|nr:hypothetical protein FSP39_025169 [Pinctada imbricata]